MNAPYHNKALPPGTILREWRLEEVLGVGGFGIVYRGRDVYFGETVAIKEYFPGAISDRVDGTTVAPTDSSSEEIYDLGRQKFLEEAKVLWNLSRPERHPNVVSVRSLFEIHGTAYMVMDFESGTSLSQMLRDGKIFDEQSLLALIKPIAEGLERAHSAGVLHRDIKPANILVNQSGRPVLIDFGSARFESGQATNTKVTFYTPPYAAIEQYVKSYPQGPWTDIYALGVVLYQCVAREKPPEVLERLHGGVGQALSARHWPGFSRVFTRAVDAAMAIRPGERPKSISEWLKLFELPDAPAEDEATRIGVPLPDAQPKAVVPPAPLTPAAVAKKAPATANSPVRTTPGRRMGRMTAGLLASVVLLAAVAAAVFALRVHEAPASRAFNGKIANTIVAGSARPALAPLLEQKLDAVIGEANKIGRPQAEISSLTDAKAKLVPLAATLKDSGKGPQDTAVLEQLNAMTAQTFRDEASLLGRAEKRLLRNVSDPLDTKALPDAAKAIAALQQAKTNLDGALALDPTRQDGAGIVDGLQQALTNFGLLQDAYNTAATFYLPAKQKEATALLVSLQTLSGQVIALANVPKPWLFASQARKRAYQLRQDNAVQAKTLATQLNDLSATVSKAKDLKQLAAAMTQAAQAKKSLDDLYAASNNAAL